MRQHKDFASAFGLCNYLLMYLNASGQKVYYEQAGTGKPLLLLHGWGLSCESLKPLFFRLAKTRLVRVMDFPGFGLSAAPPPDWGTADYAELVNGLLAGWNCGATDIIAHSFGARVAIRLAISRPERVNKIVLTGAAGIRPQREAPLMKRTLAHAAKAAGRLGGFGKWLKRRIYERIGSADYLAAGAMRPILVRVVNEDLLSLLGQVRHETLLIWGERDTETPPEMARQMNAGLLNSRLEIIKGAGHHAYASEPEVFFNLADSFLGSSE